MYYLDAMIVKIRDDDVTSGWRHGTEVWPSEMSRIGRTTRPKLVNDATIGLEHVHCAATIVNDNNATTCIAADTLRTKQLACANPEQQQPSLFYNNSTTPISCGQQQSLSSGAI